MSTDFYKQIICEYNENVSVIIEDDGRVAYAYLMNSNAIIGDVWLYNQLETPMDNSWQDEDQQPPYLNSVEYTDNLLKVENGDVLEQVDVKWNIYGSVIEVLLEFRNGLKAKLCSGSRPGWTNNAKKEGPLAAVFLNSKNL
jgi:hypothetical protein